MIRGIQKNMIWVRTPKSRYFEAAYFVMRADSIPSPDLSGKSEMLKEANRILNESNLPRRGDRGGEARPRVFPFFCGLLTGASLVAILWLTVLLFA